MLTIVLLLLGIQLIKCSTDLPNISSAEFSTETPNKFINIPQKPKQHLEKLYPLFGNTKLSKNMKSLLSNLKTKRFQKRQLSGKERDAFFLTDLEGNRLLMVRRRRNKFYPDQSRLKRRWRVLASDLKRKLQEAVDIIPVQPLMYKSPSPNSGVQELVYPEADMDRNSFNEEYEDNLEFIPLSSIKPRSVIPENFTHYISSTTSSTSKPQLQTSDLQSSKTFLESLSSLLDILERMFPVTDKSVSFAESTSPINQNEQNSDIITPSTSSQLLETSPITFERLTTAPTDTNILNLDEEEPGIFRNPTLSSTRKEMIRQDVTDWPLDDGKVSRSCNRCHQPILPLHKELRCQNNLKLINKILEDVKDIRERESEARIRENILCNITGSWSSSVGGMLLNITQDDDILDVCLHPKTPPCKTGLLTAAGWTLQSFKPLPRAGIIILFGRNIKSKHGVTFLGECRTCSGCETITGNWLVERVARDCKDQKASQKIFGDVWTRETLTERRRKRLESIQRMPTYAKDKKASDFSGAINDLLA